MQLHQLTISATVLIAMLSAFGPSVRFSMTLKCAGIFFNFPASFCIILSDTSSLCNLQSSPLLMAREYPRTALDALRKSSKTRYNQPTST